MSRAKFAFRRRHSRFVLDELYSDDDGSDDEFSQFPDGLPPPQAHAAAHADADVGRRKYERYVDVITEAEGALEALDRGEGPTARWASTLESGREARSYPAPGLAGERACALFGLASCHRRLCARETAARMAEGGLGDAGAAS